MEVSHSAGTLTNAASNHETSTKTKSILTTAGPTEEVRIVTTAEYKKAAACLAEAFRNDHAVRYPIDTPANVHVSEQDRYAVHLQCMEYMTYAHCLKGLVTAIGPNYDCVALWMKPGIDVFDWLTVLRSGLWRMSYKLTREGRARLFNEFVPLLASTKLEILGDRDMKSWYLNYIGTKPESQGKGYARKSISYVTQMADQCGYPCYLESSHDVNLIIYGKLGFKPVKEIHLKRAEHEIKMDIMVREPQAAAQSSEEHNKGCRMTPVNISSGTSL